MVLKHANPNKNPWFFHWEIQKWWELMGNYRRSSGFESLIVLTGYNRDTGLLVDARGSDPSASAVSIAIHGKLWPCFMVRSPFLWVKSPCFSSFHGCWSKPWAPPPLCPTHRSQSPTSPAICDRNDAGIVVSKSFTGKKTFFHGIIVSITLRFSMFSFELFSYLHLPMYRIDFERSFCAGLSRYCSFQFNFTRPVPSCLPSFQIWRDSFMPSWEKRCLRNGVPISRDWPGSISLN